MVLGGKAKKEFDMWLNTIPKSIVKNAGDVYLCMTFPYNFNQLSDSMKFGVLVDWFDSIGIDIILIMLNLRIFTEPDTSTLELLRKEAIKKAVEIFNNK